MVLGCGGGDLADVSPGPMPQGGSFTGVWFSPQYGEMHMIQNGGSVIGEYTKDERRGRIQGTVEGDVLRFEWDERRELVQGLPSTTRGRGYFRYAIGQDGHHNVLGEWGHDDAEVGGGPWNAVKSRRRQPRLSTDTSGGSSESSSSGSESDSLEEESSPPPSGSDDVLGGDLNL